MIYFLQGNKQFRCIGCLRCPVFVFFKRTFSNTVAESFHRIWAWLSIRLQSRSHIKGTLARHDLHIRIFQFFSCLLISKCPLCSKNSMHFLYQH